MSGKRLLDIVALFNASRSVAHKHAALRSRQGELYGKTSSVVKAFKQQTDRVTKTVEAASFLASRLNEDSQQPSAPERVPETIYQEGNANGVIPSRHSELGYITRNSTFAGNVAESPRLPKIQLEKSPLSLSNRTGKEPSLQFPNIIADGLDHQTSNHFLFNRDKETLYTPSQHTSLNSSPVADYEVSSKGATAKSSEQGRLGEFDSDSFYDAENVESLSQETAGPEQQQVPDGVDTNIFSSPRVAKILGGNLQSSTMSTLGRKHIDNSTIDQKAPITSNNLDAIRIRHPSRSSFSDSQPDTKIQLQSKAGTNSGHSYDTLKLEGVSQKEDAKGIYQLRESKVPASRLSRLWNYSGLAAGMLGGAVSESVRRLGGSGGEGSYMLSPHNMDRLVSKLSRMRGAALKLGQMISFQDSKMLPGPIQEVLQRVQDRADYMPASQRDRVLTSNLGQNWRDLYSSFDEKPLAAASIGQVHSAVLKSNGSRVAVKVQYPGVADSIDSDLNNLAILLTASRLLPKGLFLDKTIENARTELAWECDYLREAECGSRFKQLLSDEADVFAVPKIYPEASGKQVLTMEFMDGIGVTKEQSFSQEQKNWIGTQILRLCLREITEFRFMQTDPNWTNFLYNSQTQKLELLDFGASREYPESFISKYTQLLAAASRSDKELLRKLSIDLGYLTGQESKAMLEAHLKSVLTLAEPFLDSSPEIYDFKNQTITDRVKTLIPLMIRERLSPPPEETYSLHRKLSGAFLLCARLGSQVPCRMLFADSMARAGLL